MKLLNNVLIKLSRGGFTDRVLYLDHVPEEMFYEMRHPMICKGEGLKQAYVPDFEKPKEPMLYPELTRSLTGDNGIVFNLDNEQSKQRYLALNRYIKSVYSNREVPADPVVYSIDPSNSAAPALSLDKIPRVVLPVLSPAESPSVSGSTAVSEAPSVDVETIKKEAIAEYKKEQQARMAKARESRKAPVGKNAQ